MGVHSDIPTPVEAIKLDLIAMLADHAQRRHRFGALIKAADHGAALLDALDLSPLALDVMDEMIACRDMLDGDSDFEEEDDDREDDDPGEDSDPEEHDLGSLAHMDQRQWSRGDNTSLELDATDCVLPPYRRETCESLRARRDELRDLQRRAEALRHRLTGRPQPHPDTLQFIAHRNSGVLMGVFGGYVR